MLEHTVVRPRKTEEYDLRADSATRFRKFVKAALSVRDPTVDGEERNFV